MDRLSICFFLFVTYWSSLKGNKSCGMWRNSDSVDIDFLAGIEIFYVDILHEGTQTDKVLGSTLSIMIVDHISIMIVDHISIMIVDHNIILLQAVWGF